jgi:hypothetical protein
MAVLRFSMQGEDILEHTNGMKVDHPETPSRVFSVRYTICEGPKLDA